MPQLDPSSYASQIFWLIICFSFLYWVVSQRILPQIGRILEDRAARISGDITKAETLRQEAEDAQREYELALAEARRDSNELLTRTAAGISEQAAKRHTKLDETLARQLEEANVRLEKTREEAMAKLTPAAKEISRTIVDHLLSEKGGSSWEDPDLRSAANEG